MKTDASCSRSDFFKGAGVLAGAAVMAGGRTEAAETQKKPAGPPLRRMGKTDLMLPAVSLGTGGGPEINVIKFAVAQGMNFIHTSTTYAGGKAIDSVAEAIKGQRDKVILGLKITWSPDDEQAMDAALAKLGTDHADICFFHIHKAGEVKDPKYRAAAERLKKAGKFKYIGLTSHGDTAACMTAALDEGFYDVLMPSYAMSMEAEFMPIFERAAKEQVGVILMKTKRGLSGAYEESVPHYLATPGITTINKGVSSFPEIKKLVEASQQSADTQAGLRLRERAGLAMSGHCVMCGACTRSCPLGLDVADVVRCSDYYLESQTYIDMAHETYRALARTPSPAVCGSCSRCESACSNGVPIAHHIRRAQSVLA